MLLILIRLFLEPDKVQIQYFVYFILLAHFDEKTRYCKQFGVCLWSKSNLTDVKSDTVRNFLTTVEMTAFKNGLIELECAHVSFVLFPRWAPLSVPQCPGAMKERNALYRSFIHEKYIFWYQTHSKKTLHTHTQRYSYLCDSERKNIFYI